MMTATATTPAPGALQRAHPPRMDPDGGKASISRAEAVSYDAHLLADIEQFEALGIDIFDLQARGTWRD
jgi:hypothetical protein